MTDPVAAIEAWVRALPGDSTSERVRENFWYVRIPGNVRRWIPIEIDVGERSVKLTSHVIIEPLERQADVYKLLLRHNHAADGVAFSYEGKEGVICLVARIPGAEFTVDKLDGCVGRIVETTEETFRSILQIGFGSRLKRSSG